MRYTAAVIVGGCALLACGVGVARAQTLFTVAGHGYGHGIGMSQYGALGYAQHGYSYGQILAHYFTATRIAPVAQGVTERVLLSSGSTVSFGSAAALTVIDQGSGRRIAVSAGSYRIQYGTTPGRLRVVAA